MQYIALILTLLMTLNFCSSAITSQGGDNSSVENDKEEIAHTSKEFEEEVYYNDESVDVAKLESVLKKAKGVKGTNERIIAITQEFIGTPYVGGTLNIPPKEQLYVNTNGLDCATFVETVLALTMASGRENPSVADFLRNIRTLRYRNGEINGFPSRLHYTSEWAMDNERRGNFKEITPDYELSEKRVKTIDFMTKNRHLYPAMADDDEFQAIKENEKALKNMHFSIIPTSKVDVAAKKFLRSGDVVGIVTNKAGLDLSHVGFINIKNGIPYLIHASSKYKKVVNDTIPLKTYLQKQGSPGIRVFRLSGEN